MILVDFLYILAVANWSSFDILVPRSPAPFVAFVVWHSSCLSQVNSPASQCVQRTSLSHQEIWELFVKSRLMACRCYGTLGNNGWPNIELRVSTKAEVRDWLTSGHLAAGFLRERVATVGADDYGGRTSTSINCAAEAVGSSGHREVNGGVPLALGCAAPRRIHRTGPSS